MSFASLKKKQAFQFFTENGFPNRRDEWYKNTSIAHFKALTPYTAFETPKNIPAFFMHHYTEMYILVLINGVLVANLSDLKLEEGLHIYNDYAVAKNEECCDAFEALCKTFAPSILTIKVDANVQIKKPILIMHMVLNQGENQLIANQSKVILEKNAELTILEDFLNPSDTQFHFNQYCQYEIAENAQLHLNIYQEEDKFYSISTRLFNQQSNSLLSICNPIFNGNFVRNAFIVNNLGEGAHTDINGTFIPTDQAHTDIRIRVNHLAPNSTSNQFFRGVINDESSAVFNGKVYVDRLAQKTNAYQSNKNLVLSEDAQIFTKPELEIYADDVKCSHGATTGQLDENAIFYALQRGIPKEKAKALIVFAFAQESFKNMKNEAIKNFFERRLVLKMGLKEYSTAEFE